MLDLSKLSTDIHENTMKNKIVAHALNIVILILMLCFTNMTYESADDYAIAEYIVDGYPYIDFVNYYLCKALIPLQSLFPSINIFILFQIAVSYISFVYFTTIILDICDKLSLRIMIIAVIAVFSFDHYCALQFTKTSALAMTAGFVGIVHVFSKNKNVLNYILPILLICTANLIRSRNLPAAAGMAVVSICLLLFMERSNYKEWLKPRRFVVAAVLFLLIVGNLGLTKLSYVKNTETSELKNAVEYSIHRSNILDYPTFKYYEKNKEKYDEIGLSENDVFLIDQWRLDYDGAASLDNLKKIDSFKRFEDSAVTRIWKSTKKALRLAYDSVMNRSSIGIHIILLIAIAISMIITLTPRYWLYPIAIGAVTVGLYALLYFKQRAIYRAIYVVDIQTMLWLFYGYSVFAEKNGVDFRSKIARVMAIIVIAIAALSVNPLMENCQVKYEREKRKLMTAEALEFVTANGNKALVWGTGERKRTDKIIKPWLAPDSRDKNVFETGGWETMSPYIINRLKEYGMTNPIKDLIDNDQALYIGNDCIKELEQYYNDWYSGNGKTIHMEKVDEIMGKSVWRVISAPAKEER